MPALEKKDYEKKEVKERIEEIITIIRKLEQMDSKAVRIDLTDYVVTPFLTKAIWKLERYK